MMKSVKDSLWKIEIILNTISKDRMAQIYSVKYIRSLDLPKFTKALEYHQIT